MSAAVKLAVFDVDGSLVDSQAHIYAAVCAAFDASGLAIPQREAVHQIIGLSLPTAIACLAPGLSNAALEDVLTLYKDAYVGMREADGDGSSPLFPGAREMLMSLAARDDLLLAVATGKSRRGLDHVLQMHGLTALFDNTQVADLHPSKPHPAMLETACYAADCAAADTVMIGDTVFDLEMGLAAGTKTIAVTWGYHSADALRACGPDAVVDTMAELEQAVLRILAGTDV
ncbi:HAD-IA family hydrolase [Pseudoruegeria sp. SK021]|uniref:HAD-IA family hydrolase n=1 Tax=Pseudoruegeria sp. SK021 TaxID=1933035 RepID=UPI000A22CD88|nr:HAD-IA family hydrolase [Pseudoruegeria sp. SK021]OSP55158.1 hypothetical protein BV911_09010 [Pseudoruegeria sp. SK021]